MTCLESCQGIVAEVVAHLGKDGFVKHSADKFIDSVIVMTVSKNDPMIVRLCCTVP